MIIKNKHLCATYRTPGNCEFCKRWCHTREGHHIQAKGRDNGFQLDIDINLISLGAVFTCQCHRELHDGNLSNSDMLAVVAAREKCLQPDIQAVVWLLNRLPKAPSRELVEAESRGLNLGAAAVLERALASYWRAVA